MTVRRPENAGAGWRLTTVQTPRGAVECEIGGDGPAVLLLHGAMGGCDQGILLARAALDDSGFRCVAVSRPGYLGTPLALGETPEDQADLCAGVLASLGIAQAAVIAISGGGPCALLGSHSATVSAAGHS